MLQQVVNLALGGLYGFAGFVKLVPFPAAAYDGMVKDFSKFAQVFPLSFIGIIPNADTYRVIIGALELGMGLGLLFGSSSTKNLCCEGLMVIMGGAMFTLFRLGQYPMIVVPGSCLAGLYWLHNQIMAGQS